MCEVGLNKVQEGSVLTRLAISVPFVCFGAYEGLVKGGNASMVDYGGYDNRKRACVGVID